MAFPKVRAFEAGKFIGQKYGRLTVRFILPEDRYGHARVNAACICGKYWEGRLASLLDGVTKSCGCLQGKGARPAYKKLAFRLVGILAQMEKEGMTPELLRLAFDLADLEGVKKP